MSVRITKADVKTWIESEMSESYTYRPDEGSVEVIADPRVAGTFAARFKDHDEDIDLLFVTSDGRWADDPDSIDSVLKHVLEEVEYGQWPPKSGNLQFFI